MIDAAASELLALADAVRCLVPDRRDPERFHIDKHDIAARLRRLAAVVERREATARRRYLAEPAA